MMRRLALLGVAVLAVSAALGYAGFRHYEASFMTERQSRLESVAVLEGARVSQWVAERIADAQVLARDTDLGTHAIALATTGGALHRAVVETRLADLSAASGYAWAGVVDAQGNLIASAGEAPAALDEEDRRHVRRALDLGTPYVSTPHGHDGRARDLDVLAPLHAQGGVPVPAVVLLEFETDKLAAAKRLEHPETSAETMLAWAADGRITVLSGARRPQALAGRTLRVDEPDLVLAKAARGARGIVTGMDYAGVPVLAAVAEVPGTGWLLVSKVALDEVRRPVLYRAAVVTSVLLTMLALLCFALYEAFRRRAAAAQLRGQEERARLASIVNSVDDAVIACDLERNILSWNPGAERLFGYSAHEAVGRPLSMLLPPDPEPELEQNRSRIAQGQTVRSHDVVRLAKDGRRIDVSVTRSAIRDENGAVIGIARIYRDIGDAKRAAAAQQRLAAFFEHSNVAMMTRTLEGVITSWNPAAERLFGYSAQEAIGRRYEFLRGQAEQRPSSNEALAEGRSVGPYRAQRIAKGGRAVDVLVTLCPLPGRSGRVEAAAVTFQDLSQLRELEIALTESEERLKAAFEQAAVGMALRALDAEQPRWLRVNRKLCEILGYTEAELLGMTSLDVTPAEDRAESLVHGRRLEKGPAAPYSREKRYVRKDGRVIWVNITLAVVRRADGTPQHLISVVEDITARKLAEERLHFQAGVLDMVGEAVIATDPSGAITYWNRRAEHLHGWRWDEVAGRNVLEVTTTDASRAAGMAIMEGLARGSTSSGEIELKRRDGSTFIAMATTAPLLGRSGEITGYVGITRDITQRKLSEQALIETQRKLELAVASAGVGFWEYRPATGDIVFGREWKSQLGYAEDEIADTLGEWERLCHPEDIERVYATMHDALREKRPTYDNEFRMRHRDGRYRWILSRASVHCDALGNPERIIGGHIDITERKKTETQLARRTAFYAALAETNEAITVIEDETALLHRVCDIAVEKTGLLLASVGLLDEQTGDIRPVAVAGAAAEFARGLVASIDATTAAGQGPAGRALRENAPCIVEDYERDPGAGSLRERARAHGIRSSVSFPLHRAGRVHGGFCVYSAETRFFDDELVRLLHELTLDISLALENRSRERHRREAEAKLRESENRYRMVVAHIPEGVVMLFDHALRFQLADGAALRQLGLVPSEVVGRTLHETLPESAQEIEPHYRRALGGTPSNLEIAAYGREWAAQVLPVHDANGATVAGMVIARDLTEKHRAEEQLRLAALAFGNIADGVMITDAALRIVSVNRAFTAITGYSEEEARGKTPAMLHSSKQDHHFYDEMWARIRREGHWQGEIWNRRKNGEVYPELLSISAVSGPSGAVTHYVGVFNDISRFKAYEERLEYLAHHDALTGLPNRTLLEDRVEVAIGAAERSGKRVALLFVDLDRFKLINDTLGHAVGDELLIAVARRLTGCLREMDTVSRHGGDEFLVLLPNLEDSNDAALIAGAVLGELAKPYSVGAHQLTTSVSIGIAIYPENGAHMADLLRNADAAMYAAKELGRSRFQFYTDSMNARAAERLTLDTDLRLALQNDQLHLVYQPQFDLRSGAVVGVEALLRWRHPVRGDIPPAAFIPVAEDTGQIVAIGEWALRAACRQAKSWLDRGLLAAPVAVNVSAIQFRQANFAAVVAQVLSETGLAARCLQLEVTESVLMSGLEVVSETLQALHARGITLAIDDFGIGYSSLSYLRHLPIHQLKIDASFVRDVPASKDAMVIIEAIAGMARSLDVQVIAEGVERADQAAFLRSVACNVGQGYLYCRPLLPADLEAWLASGTAASARRSNGEAVSRQR